MAGETDAALRDAARHRGLKLVTSRRRKPGVGDYGRYGLTDAGGAPLMGIGDDGLTATADEVAAFLRHGAAATWAESARITPAVAKRVAVVAAEDAPVTPRVEQPAPRRVRPARSAERVSPAPEAAPPPAPAPLPKLLIRPAKAEDAAAVAALIATIGGTGDTAAVAQRIAAAARAKAPLLVAEQGGVIGCLQWLVLATVHRGTIGRIAMIVVTERARRRGIGTALLDAAVTHCTRAGCTAIEGMTDIAVANANGFFRAARFAQVSYRFVRHLDGAGASF